MARRDFLAIVLAMVLIAGAALIINHIAFSSKDGSTTESAATTSTIIESSNSSQAYIACKADGATISTAIAAFDANNPGVSVTENDLVASTLGGPYLQSWLSVIT